MTDVRKIHVVYICNFVSSIDWQIRFGRDFLVLSGVARRVMCISATVQHNPSVTFPVLATHHY